MSKLHEFIGSDYAARQQAVDQPVFPALVSEICRGFNTRNAEMVGLAKQSIRSMMWRQDKRDLREANLLPPMTVLEVPLTLSSSEKKFYLAAVQKCCAKLREALNSYNRHLGKTWCVKSVKCHRCVFLSPPFPEYSHAFRGGKVGLPKKFHSDMYKAQAAACFPEHLTLDLGRRRTGKEVR